jgi:hypothetical protein
MSVGRLLAVSVDLDGPGCYHAIHGLGPPGDHLLAVHYTAGLVRFLELLGEVGVRATLFAVGRDLERPACIEVIREAAAAGHEVANHTLDHHYGLTRMDAGIVRGEIDGGADRIREATGEPPAGFRAPGYHLSEVIVRILGESGYEYDASLLPSPPYYMAKVASMGWMWARRRRSGAIAGHPGMVLSPNRPFRMGRPFWLPGRGLPELPCTVVPAARIPFIGTSLALAGRDGAVAAARLVGHKRFVGLEFHALDLMDADLDGLRDVASHQPDLRVPLDRRRETFASVLRTLLGRGFEPVTLRDARARLFPGQP